jgi:hypothetical protein
LTQGKMNILKQSSHAYLPLRNFALWEPEHYPGYARSVPKHV